MRRSRARQHAEFGGSSAVHVAAIVATERGPVGACPFSCPGSAGRPAERFQALGNNSLITLVTPLPCAPTETAYPMATHSSLLARFDRAEYRLCRRLNRGVEHTGVRVFFKTASRLGDGVIWYALMLALPLHLWRARSARSRWSCSRPAPRVSPSTNSSSAPSCASGPSSATPASRWRGAPLDRYSFPSGHTLHAVAFTWQACAAFPGARFGAGAAGAGHRRLARGARTALSHRRAGRRLVRRDAAAPSARRDRLYAGMRVLFVSDVYFPRVNGVSTSIRTFRGDLAQLGRRNHAGRAGLSRRRRRTPSPAIIRVPSGGVPRDPEDRRFPRRRRCSARSNAELAARVDLVHIHTPFIAHYAGVRFARAARPAGGRDLSHLLRGLPASLRADPAARHRPLHRAPLHAAPNATTSPR